MITADHEEVRRVLGDVPDVPEPLLDGMVQGTRPHGSHKNARGTIKLDMPAEQALAAAYVKGYARSLYSGHSGELRVDVNTLTVTSGACRCPQCDEERTRRELAEARRISALQDTAKFYAAQQAQGNPKP